MKIEVRELPPAPPPPKEYVLTLSHDESVVLCAVLGQQVGRRAGYWRVLGGQLHDGLAAAINWQDARLREARAVIAGELRFKESA